MLIFLLSCLILCTTAQSLGFGRCPEVTTVTPFDAKKYTGVWYEYERSFPNPFEFAGRCVIANYTAADNGTIKVVNSQISSITGGQSSIEGVAMRDAEACGNVTECSKLIVKFPVPVIGETTGTYWVLDTDYDSYSVVWSCTDYYLFHASFAWVLTRDRNPKQEIIDKAKKVFANNKIDCVIMLQTDQENCS